MATETKQIENATITGENNKITPPQMPTKRSLSKEPTEFTVRFKQLKAAAILYKRKAGNKDEVSSFRHRIGGANLSINLGQLYDDTIKGNNELLELYVLDALFLEQYIEVADDRFNEWIEWVNLQNGKPLNGEQILDIQRAYAEPNTMSDVEIQCFKHDNIELYREALAEAKASYSK